MDKTKKSLRITLVSNRKSGLGSRSVVLFFIFIVAGSLVSYYLLVAAASITKVAVITPVAIVGGATAPLAVEGIIAATKVT